MFPSLVLIGRVALCLATHASVITLMQGGRLDFSVCCRTSDWRLQANSQPETLNCHVQGSGTAPQVVYRRHDHESVLVPSQASLLTCTASRGPEEVSRSLRLITRMTMSHESNPLGKARTQRNGQNAILTLPITRGTRPFPPKQYRAPGR